MQELNKKQQDVLECVANEDPRIIVLSGAKRAGKTFILNLIFLAHIALFYGSGKAFILGGTTYSSIRRNVLNDWEEILGVKELRLKDDNHIDILGCKVYVLPGGDASSYKSVRGFTSYGAMLNEATTLHPMYIQECFSRCSGEGARIYMDTNPENPTHIVKTDYIDKDGDMLDNERVNIRAFHFTLFDNEFLSKEYVQSIIKTTPTGMFTDRDIYGRWVSPEGVVYRDFNAEKHLISINNIPKNIKWIKFFAGVDWGYSHKGSITILGMDTEHNIYVIEEHTKQYKEIDYWVEIAKEFKKRYGNISFFADSARPEHVARFNREGIRCINANKKVIAGIEVVSKLLKVEKLFFISEKIDNLLQEFNLYIWDEKTGMPMKVNDDALDSIRYAIYSFYIQNPKLFEGVI